MLMDGEVIQTMKLFVSGQKSRVEGMTAGSLGNIVSINRRDKGLSWVLYPTKREYTESSLAASTNSNKPDLSTLDLATMSKKSLGRETVLGYACAKMQVTAGKMPNGQPLIGTVWVADSLDLPIRLDFMGIIQENRNLKIGTQPAALFEIPAGYRKTQSPLSGMKNAAIPTVPPTRFIAPRVATQVGNPVGNAAQESTRAASAVRLEADTLNILKCTSGEAMPRKLSEDGYANEGDFTGDLSLQWHDAAEPGALLEIALPVATKGRYAISVRVAKYRTYGIHQFLINGTPLGKPVDMFGNPGHDIVTAFNVNLGEVNLNAGNNRLGIRLVGTNADTIMANHGAGLDWVNLTPVGAKQ
jgi:hypothetical protein